MRLMTQALNNITEIFGNLMLCYVDDIVIATPTLENHIGKLDKISTCMKQASLKCKRPSAKS